MDNLERFSALIKYIGEHPETVARHGKTGVALLRRVVTASQKQDNGLLDSAIDAFLGLVGGGKDMRGIIPSSAPPTVEQFNRIEQSAQAVLDKLTRG